MFRKLTASILVLGLFGGLASLSVIALFTDSQSVSGNLFSTGTVDISTSPASLLVTYSNMAPGDEVVGGVTVSNAGTLDLRYAVTSTTTENTLAAQLDLTVWDEAAEADAGTACAATAPGTVLYSPADLGSTAGVNIVGNPTQGAQAGDRPLAASGSEVLCFKVALPLSTGNAYQALSTTATFAFQAEQTRNN